MFYLKLLVIGMVIASQAKGEVTQLSLELKKMPFQRDYFIGEEITEWDHEVSLNFVANVNRIFLESDLTGQTRNSRFRNMWWDYTLGVKAHDYLDFIWDHRSQHSLDELVASKFPVKDSYGIRINFIP